MRKSATLAEARAAKQKLAKIVEGDDSVTGIGITEIDEGYGIKLNVTDRPTTSAKLPGEIDGVPVKVESVGQASKRT